MTTYGSDPSTTTGLGTTGTTPSDTGTSGTSTTDKARETASTAADQSRHVAGTAKDEALDVASTAAQQARSVVGEARQQVTSQLSDQATTGRDRLSETLRTLGDDLQQMAEGQGPAQGMATDLAREVSDRVRALGSHLEGREPTQLLDDARDFARRRPGTFLLGALAAGVVAGRLFRATADGAAAASLADSGGTGVTTPVSTPAGDTGVGVGPMGTASGSAALAGEPTAYDTPVTPATTTMPSSADSTSSGLPGQHSQDAP